MNEDESDLFNLSYFSHDVIVFDDNNNLETRKYVWSHLIFVSVILITIIGNIMVVLAVLKNRCLQNTTNYFLMSLAIADSLVAIVVMPISVITEIIGKYTVPGVFIFNPRKIRTVPNLIRKFRYYLLDF